MFVYVLNKRGEALMPCKPRKARILLKEKKAKVVKRTPFTIQLLYGSSGYKQPVSLGVDAGTKSIGLSATTDKQETNAIVKGCFSNDRDALVYLQPCEDGLPSCESNIWVYDQEHAHSPRFRENTPHGCTMYQRESFS